MEFLAFAIVTIVYLLVVRNIAKSANKSVIGWCLLCLLLPGIGLLFLAYKASQQKAEQ